MISEYAMTVCFSPAPSLDAGAAGQGLQGSLFLIQSPAHSQCQTFESPYASLPPSQALPWSESLYLDSTLTYTPPTPQTPASSPSTLCIYDPAPELPPPLSVQLFRLLL